MSNSITDTALEAIENGFQPVPIMDGTKRPYGSAWNKTEPFENTEQGRSRAKEFFEKAQSEGAHNIGLRLGDVSNGLIDIDLDHHLAIKLSDYFLPPTTMEHGREDSPRTHRWYQVEGEIPQTRRYVLPTGEVTVELRSSGSQTVIPPSKHPSGVSYEWSTSAFGGDVGAYRVPGNVLALQVAVLSLACNLLENFPKKGSRHEAYLNLAGGLLRHGDTVHEFWEHNLPSVIRAIAEVTHDEDKDKRVSEVMRTTIEKIRKGDRVGGFPKLGEIIGEDSADAVRRSAKEVESLAGYTPDAYSTPTQSTYVDTDLENIDIDEIPSSDAEDNAKRNPMEERVSTWESVDLSPYLSGEIYTPEPSILRREDGRGAFYPGRVNMLYGSSESAKTWIAMHAGIQEMRLGERVVFIDLEDEPVGAITRLRLLGATPEDIQTQFRYVHPESPLAPMERGKYGSRVSDSGKANDEVFREFLKKYDPTLIIVDGMTVLYGMHGHDTNDAAGTNVITDWLKSLTRGGRTAVIVIDHTGKNGGQGSSPIGAHHKIAMVQGSAIRADAVDRPRPGDVGNIKLSVFKDRLGEVREVSTSNSNEQVFANVVMDSTDENRVVMTVEEPSKGLITLGANPVDEKTLKTQADAEKYAGKILELFGGDLDKQLTTGEVISELGVKPHFIYRAWQHLEDDGLVKPYGARKGRYYMLEDVPGMSMSDEFIQEMEADEKDD